ncbi:MAG TPA: response regulator [Candidatus Limnocylindrales bacterium]|nr:response regulator [Candidatus Limnocylindrales bacterium]
MLNGNGSSRPRLTGSILVVEDDADIRSMTLTILEAAGAKVAGAASAAEAIQCLQRASFDAIVLDWNLAGDTGGALLQQLRDHHPALLRRSAVVTGDLLSIPGQHEAEHFGCPVIAKPFRPAQLVETMAAILA